MNKKWYIIFSTSGGFFLWGVIASLAPLATSWSIFSNNKFYYTIALITGPLFMLIGNYIMGYLADIYGRKRIFILSISLYILGSLIIYISINFIIFEIGLILSNFGIGGEEPPALSILSENFEPSERKYTLTLVPNMFNLGGLVLAYLTLLPIFASENAQRFPFILISILGSFILLIVRIYIPESYLWLKRVGKEKDSEIVKNELKIVDDGVKVNLPPKRLIYIILILLGVSQYMSFWLLAITIGPYFYPNQTGMIILYAMLGATIGGFISLPVIKLGKKLFTLISFSFGFLSILILLFFINNFTVFLMILMINMVFSEFAWISRTNLEPELFETLNRSRGIATVRILPITIYIIMLYVSIYLNIQEFITINIVLWLIGLMAAYIWYIRGIETINISLDM
ncbi:MAG: MFS transporter [Thermoplasmata archaeon]